MRGPFSVLVTRSPGRRGNGRAGQAGVQLGASRAVPHAGRHVSPRQGLRVGIEGGELVELICDAGGQRRGGQPIQGRAPGAVAAAQCGCGGGTLVAPISQAPAWMSSPRWSDCSSRIGSPTSTVVRPAGAVPDGAGTRRRWRRRRCTATPATAATVSTVSSGMSNEAGASSHRRNRKRAGEQQRCHGRGLPATAAHSVDLELAHRVDAVLLGELAGPVGGGFPIGGRDAPTPPSGRQCGWSVWCEDARCGDGQCRHGECPPSLTLVGTDRCRAPARWAQ